MMMSSSEFKTLIERNVGKIYFEETISKNRFSQLRLFLEKELGVIVPDLWSSTMTYIDLWRKVNTLTETQQKTNNKKKSKMKSKEPEIEEKTSVVLVSSLHSNGLAISNKIAKKISDISSQIEDDKGQLKYYLNKIENTKSNVEIGSYIGFVPKKDDIVESISEVYSTFREYILTCGNAIRSANGNISNLLELIQLLATAEADIYNLIDDQSLASNELRVLIKDWCKEHGIHDEEVDKLLESSFQRAYTLRDRINDLRKDLYEKIDKNNEQIKELLSHYSDYQAKIQEATDSALLSLKTSADERKQDIDKHSFEKQKELQKCFELLSSSVNKEIERGEALKQSIDNKDKEFSERVNLHFSEIGKRERSIEQLSIEKTEELKTVARDVTEKKDEIEKEVNDILNNLKQTNQTFQSNFFADFKEKKEEIDNELTRMKENQECFKEKLNKNFEEKVQGLEHQLKTYKIVAIIAGIASVVTIVIGLLV